MRSSPSSHHESRSPLSLCSLTINGRYMDEAVVCTSSRTYALRQVSQSNSLLLCSLLPRSRANMHHDQHEPLEPPSSSDSGLSIALQQTQPHLPLQQPQVTAQAGNEQQLGNGAATDAEAEEMVLSLKSMIKDTLELQWTSPKLDRISSLLKDSMYAGPDEERRRERKAQQAGAEDVSASSISHLSSHVASMGSYFCISAGCRLPTLYNARTALHYSMFPF